jgi:hypothetical protein
VCLTRRGRHTRARLIGAAEDELLEFGRIEVTKVAAAARSAWAEPRLAAAAIIASLRSCLAVALADGSSIRPQQVIDTAMSISAALITDAAHAHFPERSRYAHRVCSSILPLATTRPQVPHPGPLC